MGGPGTAEAILAAEPGTAGDRENVGLGRHSRRRGAVDTSL